MVTATTGMVDVASTLDFPWESPTGPSHRNNKEKAQRRMMSVYDSSVDIHVTVGDTILPPGPGTPRHHHNFDQVRMTLSGATQYGPQKVGAGDLQYVPESTDYGPQTRDETAPRQYVFQFPGQSNLPFFPYTSAQPATRELMDQGVEFKDGIARFPDGHNQDAFEAVWEHLAGRKIEYAPRRYGTPYYFHTNAFDWEPTEVEGVFTKHFAHFNEYGPNLGFVKLKAGAASPTHAVNWLQFRVVIEGEAEYNGKKLPDGSRIYEGPGAEAAPITSETGATLLVMQIGYRGKTDPAPVALI